MSPRSRPKKPSAAAHANATVPWWLAGGQEQCPRCEHAYAYEIEVRCIDCDGPLCPVCAAWVEKRRYCPECVPGMGA